MNPLAQNLNNQLVDHCPEILSMLSNLGQSMYYPKGILSQSAMLKKLNITLQLEWLLIKTGKCMRYFI